MFVVQQTICEGGKNKCELFESFSGTSMASPHVAGVAAMLVGAGVTDMNALRSSLTSTAVAKDDAKLYGAGIVDAANAVARTHWTHLILRVFALVGLFALVASRIKRQGGQLARSPVALIAALFASVGLVPIAPLLKLGTLAGPFRWIVELAQRPFGEWDMLLGVGIHKWLPLASALPVLALTMLFFGAKKLRFAVGGFAVGTAALLAQMAFSADVAFVGGSFLLRVYAVASAAVCLWIARIGLDAKKAS
jgi:serine protease